MLSHVYNTSWVGGLIVVSIRVASHNVSTLGLKFKVFYTHTQSMFIQLEFIL